MSRTARFGIIIVNSAWPVCNGVPRKLFCIKICLPTGGIITIPGLQPENCCAIPKFRIHANKRYFGSKAGGG